MAETVYYVGFNANGGEGEMASLTHDMATGKYTLPECGFTAPSGKGFKAWNVNGVEYPAGAQIELTEDVVIKAVWASYRVAFSGNNFTAGQMSATILPGQSFTTTVTPSADYKLPDEIEVKIGETKLVLGTDYTYDKASGVITVNASAITGDLSIRVDAILAKYSVTISATNATFTADEKMTIGEDYVVVFDINAGYEFDSIIVKRGGTYTFTEGTEYTYVDGVLTIFAEQITGTFQIWFAAKAIPTTYDVTFTGGN